MSESVVKKIEVSMEFISAFEQARERLVHFGVDGFTLSEYIEFLQSSIQQEAIEEFIESKIPLKARLMTALESKDEVFMLEIQRLLDKQSRMRSRRPKDALKV